MAAVKVVPLLPNLLTKTKYAVNPLLIVCRRLEEEEWTRRVLRVLTLTGYAAVITDYGRGHRVQPPCYKQALSMGP